MTFKRLITGITILLITILCLITILPAQAKGNDGELLILHSSTKKVDLYPSMYMLKDREINMTINDVLSAEYAKKFVHSNEVLQKSGFFNTATWLRFDVKNESNKEDWLLEFAFPLIYYINIYEEDESGVIELVETGANYPFAHREIAHRNFIFNLEIEKNKTKTYYMVAHGGGDVHPPISIWEADAFIQKTQVEFVLLGLFYGMILVMIVYNLFLYFSLRLKSYLYYVLAIASTMIGQFTINGLSYQYLWPNSPSWNLIATPFWVSVACIFILIFTRRFLDTDYDLPKFKRFSYMLMLLNGLVIVLLFFLHYAALNLMLLSTISTFVTVLAVAFISLKRGARQARFFIVGWLVFLAGVFITILERATILPYSHLTEYAGQASLAIEVVLLSLALADKINIMRLEKEIAEREVSKSQAVAMASLKKSDELKDEFLAITSHELRTPLYGIIGLAESLRDGVTGDVTAEMGDQLGMIISSGKRLTHLVNDILDFSKLKHDSLDIYLKPVHLSGVVDVIFTICQPLIKDKKLQLLNNIDETLPLVVADVNRLQQILYNLVGNAIKYTDTGEVIVSAVDEDGIIKVSVADTGRGIPIAQQKSVFESFTQGDTTLIRDIGGAGIGLSITKQLVNLHGGEIDVKSKVGQGSIFSFTLPFQNHDEKVEEEAVTEELSIVEESVFLAPNLQNSTREAKILVVDDEPVNLQVLMNQLTLEGYDVITVSNGEEVLSIIDEQPIELLILDIMMPKMSGYDVCKQIRKKYSLVELPILMLTAKSQVRDKTTSFEVGANDYLTKPCDKEELLSRVRTLIRLRKLNQEIITMNLELEEIVQERTKALEVANTDLTIMNENLITMAESRRHLLANIAHELGTPVTLIHSYVQALQKGLVESDDPYYSELVYDKINVLSRLIYDLSDLSKLEAGHASLTLKKVNLKIWLEQILRKLELDVVQYGRVFLSSTSNVTWSDYSSNIDIERMDQVFSNLIRNAVKNTSKIDGEITVEVDLQEDNGLLVLQLKDNGFGISEEQLPLIFERFFKGSGSSNENGQSGTGLGLAIVKEIIHWHKGSVWVESKVNEGSIFFIALPIEQK